MIRPIKWTCGLSGHEHHSEAEARVCEMQHTVSAPYGWCTVPGCNKRGYKVERLTGWSLPGDTNTATLRDIVTCEKGHRSALEYMTRVSQPKSDRSETCPPSTV